MPSGRSLLLKRQYEEAIPLLEKAADRFRADDSSRIRAALELAICHIAIGNFVQANELLDTYIAETRSRVSLHFTYKAVSNFFAGSTELATECLLRGLRCQYQHESGLDIPWLAYFLSVREAPGISKKRAQTLMKELLKPLQNPNLPSLPKDATELITEYLLAETTEENLRIGAVNLQGRNVKGRRANNLAQVEFYVAVKRLEARDGNGYRAGLEACLKVKGVDDVLIEQVIAFRELRAETTSKRAKSAKKR